VSNTKFEVIGVILPHPQDTSEFLIDEEGTDDDGEEDQSKPKKPSSGDEIGIGELLVTIRTVSDRILINSPFPCKVLELNGEVEDNADLANDDAFGDGWFLIVKPHEFDEDQFLDAGEYIEYLNEL
jgi:glycine cleavage system H lipoate-binding protein